MTPAQANQIAEYHARLTFVSSRAIAEAVKVQALAAGDEALKWAQSMPNVLNSWAWWDAVRGRFEQALTEAMAGRDPLGEKPVHHRWGVPLSAEHARQVDEDMARSFAIGVPFAAEDMRDMLHRFIPQPSDPPLPDINRIKTALAAIIPSTPATPPARAPRGRRSARSRAGRAQAAHRLR